MESDFLSLNQAHKEFGFSPSWLYKKSASRQIKAYKPGGKLFFSRKDLEDYIKSGEKRSVSELQSDSANQLFKLKKKHYDN